jgi:hypothetical protein
VSRLTVALLTAALAGCSGGAPLLAPATSSAVSGPVAESANEPLLIDGQSHVVVLEYEAWFGPHAVTFADAEAMPILQSKDMRHLGGGYDSTDPHVIKRHLRWMQYMGIDAAAIDLTNNVGCIFSSGPVSPKFCDPATKQFRNFNRVIRNNTGNLYPAWSKLGAPVKLIPLLGCQTKLDLQPGTDGTSGFQKEVEYFGRLMKQYPQLNVVHLGHPLMLVYIGTPVDVRLLERAKAVLHAGGFDMRYTFRIAGGFLDSQPTFWANPSRRPDGPTEIARRYGFWSYVDRLKPAFALYPTYSLIPSGRTAENLTVSVATPGQKGWGCPRPLFCPEDATRYGTTPDRYVTLEHFMTFAVDLRPTFLIVHQFNEFVRPDEGWDAQTSNDIEPTRMPKGWGYGGLDTVRKEVAEYKKGVRGPGRI